MDWEAMMGMTIGFGLLVGLPITWMLLNHQRKMAELIHSNREERKNDGMHRIQALEDEVRQLRGTLHELVLRNDDLQELNRSTPPARPASHDDDEHDFLRS